MQELNTWQQQVINKILLNKEPLITLVNNVDFWAYLAFNRKTYDNVVELIKSKNWDGLKANIDKCESDFKEDLILVRITNHDGKKCLATIYDSEELWQDPEVIDIFTFN